MVFLSFKNIKNVGLFGVGPGNYCGFYGRALYDYFLNDYCGQLDGSVYSIEKLINDKIEIGIPDCSYNELIRIATEIGVIGLAICLILTIIAIYKLYVNNELLAFGLLSLLVFSQFSFTYMYRLYYVIFALFLTAGASVSYKSNTGKVRYILILILSVVFLFVNVYRLRVIKELDVRKELVYMKEFYNSGMYPEVINIASSLYENEYCSQSFLLQYGEALSKTHNYVKSDEILTHGVEMSASPFFWRLLGENSSSVGNYEIAEQQYIHSFVMSPNRIQPLYDLALLYNRNDDKEKLSRIIDYAVRLMPKIENEKTISIRKKIIYLNVQK